MTGNALRTSLLVALALLAGCDSGSSNIVSEVVRFSSVQIAAVRVTDINGVPRYSQARELSGTFRFAVGARLTQVVSGDCEPTSSGECLPNLVVRDYPIGTELVLDTDIVADGASVAAGSNLAPLLGEEFQTQINGQFLRGNRLRDQVFSAASVLLFDQFVEFDSDRVLVPDGERTLTLSWTLPSGEVISNSATFDYTR